MYENTNLLHNSTRSQIFNIELAIPAGFCQWILHFDNLLFPLHYKDDLTMLPCPFLKSCGSFDAQ